MGSMIQGISLKLPPAELAALGSPRTLTGDEKNRWLRALLTELRREGYDRATVRIAELGSNVFLVVSARPLDSIRELVDAQNGLRPIGNFAVVAQGGYAYVFAASIYEAAAERGFEEFLASVQFSQ